MFIYGTQEFLKKTRPTFNLGGVVEPTCEKLSAMQHGNYILHARGGALEQIPAEKSEVPHDPDGHTQRVQIALHPNGSIYISQGTLMSRSDDGGRTWAAHESPWKSGPNSPFTILDDGMFIGVKADSPDGEPDIWAFMSSDEGRTWEKIGRVGEPGQLSVRHAGSNLCRLSEDGLVIAVESRERWCGDPEFVYRSKDGGKTWAGPIKASIPFGDVLTTERGYICGASYETSIGKMASGRLLACIRYHGSVVENWPLFSRDPFAHYKTVFLSDSIDDGETWHNLRPLANVHGQCHGDPLGLRNGSVIVTHDHRYTPGTPCGRAMISHNEGETWEDEAYYLYFGAGQSGFSQSLELEDGTILTVGAKSEFTKATRGKDWFGRADLTAIRWNPASPSGTV